MNSYISTQQPTTKKDREIKEKRIWCWWFLKNKILSSLIAVKGVQISAISLLNRAQKCLHFTWEEISASITSVHSITPSLLCSPTQNFASDEFSYWCLQITNHPLAALIHAFHTSYSQNKTGWCMDCEDWKMPLSSLPHRDQVICCLVHFLWSFQNANWIPFTPKTGLIHNSIKRSERAGNTISWKTGLVKYTWRDFKSK